MSLRHMLGGLKVSSQAEREPIDLIVEAQRHMPDEATWTRPPTEFTLNAECNRPQVGFVLQNIGRALKQSITDISLRAILELFRESHDDENFTTTFNAGASRYLDLVVNRPSISCDMPDPNTISYLVKLTPQMQGEWLAELPALRERLHTAEIVAAQNGLELKVGRDPENEAAGVYLRVANAIPSQPGALNHGPRVIMHFSPYTDTVSFKSQVSGPDGTFRKYNVSSQRTAMMSAQAFISLRNALEAAGDFITLAERDWTAVKCAANCSVTLNEDSFLEGFFEVVLEGPKKDSRFDPQALKELYVFSWEETESSELEFFQQWNDRPCPQSDSIKLPANALTDDDIRLQLVRLTGTFGRLSLDFGNRGNFCDLYDPEERVAVVRKVLDELTRIFKAEECGSNYTLELRQAHAAYTYDVGRATELFSFHVFDTQGKIVQVGAFSATSFETHTRPHSMELEHEALRRLQAAIDKAGVRDAWPLPLEEAKLRISESQLNRLRDSAMFYAMQGLCRDPWNTLAMEGDTLVIADRGHPRAPDVSINYGNMGDKSSSIFIYRHAAELYRIQQIGKNNGYTFFPNDAFISRYEAETEQRLELD